VRTDQLFTECYSFQFNILSVLGIAHFVSLATRVNSDFTTKVVAILICLLDTQIQLKVARYLELL
jgi:hypothetical protein